MHTHARTHAYTHTHIYTNTHTESKEKNQVFVYNFLHRYLTPKLEQVLSVGLFGFVLRHVKILNFYEQFRFISITHDQKIVYRCEKIYTCPQNVVFCYRCVSVVVTVVWKIWVISESVHPAFLPSVWISWPPKFGKPRSSRPNTILKKFIGVPLQAPAVGSCGRRN